MKLKCFKTDKIKLCTFYPIKTLFLEILKSIILIEMSVSQHWNIIASNLKHMFAWCTMKHSVWGLTLIGTKQLKNTKQKSYKIGAFKINGFC